MNASLRKEFSIYCEILHGKLQPTRTQFDDPHLLANLIEYANTQEFLNLEIPQKEYLKIGYRTPEDFIILKGSTNNLETVTIIPNKYYLIGDKLDNDIIKPPCYKSKCYLQLLMDEFERIKIRARNLLNMNTQTEELKILATKNLRNAEFLLRESSAYSHYLVIPENDNKKQTLYYINDCLKKFLIKSIRFYHRLFNPFITEYYNSSKKLINNIDKTTSADCIKYIYQDNVNMINDNSSDYEKQTYNKSGSPKLRWTSKINQLTTLFLDLLEKGIIEIKDENTSYSQKVSKFPETFLTNMDLVDFIHLNFLDNKGHTLSKETLRTYLNPKRIDKKSKRSHGINLDKIT